MMNTPQYMPPELLPPPENWAANATHRLSRLEIQRASTEIKRFVEARLESDLNVIKVSKSVEYYRSKGSQ